MSPKVVKRLLRLIIPPVFWLGVWQFAALRAGMELKLPSPLSVAQALGELALQPPFWQAVSLSLVRIFLGMGTGVLIGALLAAATSASLWGSALLSPAIKVVRATPVVSFILLVWLWSPRSAVPSVIASLMVLPVIWGNVSKGVAQTDPKLLEMARAYRFSPAKTLSLVYLPSVRPYFTSSLVTATGLAWKSGVAAEAICLPKMAIGTQVYYAKLYLESPKLFAWTAAVIFLSFTLEKLIATLLEDRKEKGA